MTDTQQYIRRCNLIAADDGGRGVDFEGLKIVFSIEKAQNEEPNPATFRIYNVARETINRLRNEFTRVIFQAGYESNYGVIFTGNIKQVILGKENGTDTYVDIYCGDGDEAYISSVLSTSIAAGMTQEDQINIAASSMSGSGVGKGQITSDNGQRLARGKVFFGMSRDYMRSSAKNCKASWSIQDGQIQVLKSAEPLEGQAVVLNSSTGLVGTPNQTNQGIEFTCLLNPMLKIGKKVHFDEAFIQEDVIDEPSSASKISEDGYYKVIKIEYIGDTFGNDWYCKCICVAI